VTCRDTGGARGHVRSCRTNCPCTTHSLTIRCTHMTAWCALSVCSSPHTSLVTRSDV
jgi:hypothetical protein